MNIYIYGSESFKKEISKVLVKDSIKDKLSEIAELNELFGKNISIVRKNLCFANVYMGNLR